MGLAFQEDCEEMKRQAAAIAERDSALEQGRRDYAKQNGEPQPGNTRMPMVRNVDSLIFTVSGMPPPMLFRGKRWQGSGSYDWYSKNWCSKNCEFR